MSPELDIKNTDIEINRTFDFTELETRLRRVQLKDKVISDFFPYLHAKISLQEVSVDSLRPSALYVLKDNLDRVQAVNDQLANKGIDVYGFNQSTALVDYNYGGRGGIILGPPIVEVSDEDSGALVVADGLHRVTRAKMDGRKRIVVLKIENAAMPLPVFPIEWYEVKVEASVPSEKRRYRFDKTYDQIKEWKVRNYPKFIQGFNFPELNWKNGVYPEVTSEQKEAWNEVGKKERAAAIVLSNDKILMVKRASSGLWGLPAGKVEPFDKPDFEVSGMSVRRELFEETGLVGLRWRKVGSVSKSPNHGFIYEVQVTDKVHVDIALEDYVSEFNKSRGNSEVSKLALFSMNQLKGLNKKGQIFKPEYNMTALENFFGKRDSDELVFDTDSLGDESDIFWHYQENLSFDHMLDYYDRLGKVVFFD